MTDKAKQVVETIKQAFSVFADMELPMEERVCMLSHDAAMTLIDELEQVKQERDGLNILLAQSQSMLKTRTRERDAAMQDLDEMHYNICGTCKYCEFEANAKPCASCDFGTGEELGNWQWRGVKEE